VTTAANVGNQEVAIQVSDGLGGVAAQSFALTVSAAAPANIQGTVFDDVNGNGIRDLDVNEFLVSSANDNQINIYNSTT